MAEPKEWWIKEHLFINAEDAAIQDLKTIRVIEYSAYEAELARSASLEQALKELIESEARCNFRWTTEHNNAWGHALRLLEQKT